MLKCAHAIERVFRAVGGLQAPEKIVEAVQIGVVDIFESGIGDL
jgi:hypothetical protein